MIAENLVAETETWNVDVHPNKEEEATGAVAAGIDAVTAEIGAVTVERGAVRVEREADIE